MNACVCKSRSSDRRLEAHKSRRLNRRVNGPTTTVDAHSTRRRLTSHAIWKSKADANFHFVACTTRTSQFHATCIRFCTRLIPRPHLRSPIFTKDLRDAPEARRQVSALVRCTVTTLLHCPVIPRTDSYFSHLIPDHRSSAERSGRP
jgi:hypothetical protein